jgi:cytochrome b6-f complex iron-sulfur subunit
MSSVNTTRQPSPIRRRFFLWLGLLTLCYPVLRFLGFKVPTKPRLIEIKTPLVAGDFFLGQDFILFAGENEQPPWAVSRRCTHLGCKINYREKEKILECPCHQSRFTPQGEVIQGPAKKALPHFKVEKLGATGGYIVTI